MTEKPMVEIDGRRFYYMFLAGAKKIIANQSALNRINVFPVNDGDTGTNMAATLRAVVVSVRPQRSYKAMTDTLAESAMLHARGNSGIIFAQFLHGVSSETADTPHISLEHFTASLKNSVRYVYEAVADPVEGTMLTVIRTWADFMYANKHRFRDFNQLFVSSKTVLEKTLAETRFKLEVLKRANVVDAGAYAFVHFISGMIECIQRKNIRELIKSSAGIAPVPEHAGHTAGSLTRRYCTEALLKDMKVDSKTLTGMLRQLGDSVVTAGSRETGRVHVHTDDPSQLFERLAEYGTIAFQKADDMLRQHQAAADRKWKTALVTDSACDLSPELLDYYQIHMLPLNIYFGDNHYLDKITMQPGQFYRRLRQRGPFPKTAQINEAAFENLYSHLASHYDSVIAVHLTSRFSGTCSSSRKAAEKISRMMNKPIMVVDSKTLSGAQGLIVLRIADAIEKGESPEQIITSAEQWVKDTRIFVSVKTLKYMVRGGRVSPLKGLIAGLLNINPIVSMDREGSSEVFGKTFSQKANMKKVFAHIQDICRDKPVWNYSVLHADNQKGAAWYAEKMESLTGRGPAALVNISPVIGANAGAGAVSVAFMYQ